MKVNYYQHPEGNFGDELNSWIWKELINDFDLISDDVALFGIGTTLWGDLPTGKVNFVLGTGVGYGRPVELTSSSKWHVLAVRGPISARVLGVDEKLAITDSAILLRNIIPIPHSKGEGGIIFMPHISAAIRGDWDSVCEMAGVEYLDPRSDSRYIIHKLSEAKLVVADAMHAAIVADTYRVPWIPVVTTAETNTMKWVDWTRSIDVDYKPSKLPQSNVLESIVNFQKKKKASGDYFDYKKQIHSVEQIAKQFEATNFSTGNSVVRGTIKVLLIKFLTSKVAGMLLSPLSAYYKYRAGEALKRIVNGPSYLSNEQKFEKLLADMSEKLKLLNEELISFKKEE